MVKKPDARRTPGHWQRYSEGRVRLAARVTGLSALGDGLWEVRSDLPSRRTARVIFCIVVGQMILLHGFIKKTPQTPKRDLDVARVRKAETEQSGEETQP